MIWTKYKINGEKWTKISNLRNQEHRNTKATSKLVWNYCTPCMKAIDHTNKKGFSRMMNQAKKAFFWSVLVLYLLLLLLLLLVVVQYSSCAFLSTLSSRVVFSIAFWNYGVSRQTKKIEYCVICIFDFRTHWLWTNGVRTFCGEKCLNM